ncbi:MAG TPA: transcriptional regulator [Frankiaceae bacterium]|nr:transcriptional regulator [Frankiaceae bacterium]
MTTGQHPLADLDDLVHQRARLGILAMLREAAKVDFVRLRETLGLTDGNLARHLQVLAEAGYVTTRKAQSRTWVSLTANGRKAFDKELAALRALVDRFV